MEVYHQGVTPTGTTTRTLYPYEYVVRQPIARLLRAIDRNCGVGNTIRPGVRQLAEWAGYASAGLVSPLLRQLDEDGWIAYDGATGSITQLADPSQPASEVDAEPINHVDPAPINPPDRPINHVDPTPINDADRPINFKDRPKSINFADRVQRRLQAKQPPINHADRFRGRMVDHDLVAAADHDQDSAAAPENLPSCGDDPISTVDRLCPAAQALTELGTAARHIESALRSRPDLTPQQVRDTWAHFDARRKRGRVNDDMGAFYSAIARGEIHSAPPTETPAAIDWQSYARRDDYGGLFRLGSDTSDLDLPGGAP